MKTMDERIAELEALDKARMENLNIAKDGVAPIYMDRVSPQACVEFMAAAPTMMQVIRELKAKLDKSEGGERLRGALQYAVDMYGKEGGPWNVPGDAGGWLERARSALNES